MFADGSLGVRRIWWLLQCSQCSPLPPPHPLTEKPWLAEPQSNY